MSHAAQPDRLLTLNGLCPVSTSASPIATELNKARGFRGADSVTGVSERVNILQKLHLTTIPLCLLLLVKLGYYM